MKKIKRVVSELGSGYCYVYYDRADTGKQFSLEEPERFYHGFAFLGKQVLIG